MSYKNSTATGFRDFVRQIRNFVCGYGENNVPVFSGSQDTAQLLWFGAKPQGTPPAAGVVNETFTITCTDDTVSGSEIFSVSSPTYSGLPDATTGVYYDQPEVSFFISIDGHQSFANGDNFTVLVTGDSASYTDDVYWQLMYEGIASGGGINGNDIQMQGRGISDDKTINIILGTDGTVADDEWTISYRMATGYLQEDPWDAASQPGVYDVKTYSLSRGRLANNDGSIAMPVHLFVNKQRFIVMNESTIGRWHGAYAGFIYPYGSPNQYPFPCIAVSNADTSNTAYTNASVSIGSIVEPAYNCGRLKTPGGTGETIMHFNASNNRSYAYNAFWPYGLEYSIGGWTALTVGEDLSHPMFPVVLSEKDPGQMLGELDGVCALPGVGLNPGDTLTDSDTNEWVVFRHPWKNDSDQYFAVRKG